MTKNVIVTPLDRVTSSEDYVFISSCVVIAPINDVVVACNSRVISNLLQEIVCQVCVSVYRIGLGKR